MLLNIDFNCQTASIKMKAVLVLSLICVSQISSALIAPVQKRNQVMFSDTSISLR
jgi:hypothetical protein